jgi:hypothetical protein
MANTLTHIVTGSFGAGKTTAIRRLMAAKPSDELWVVILNEFTDAGLDALTVAQSAQGRYDVRLVSGGCLSGAARCATPPLLAGPKPAAERETHAPRGAHGVFAPGGAKTDEPPADRLDITMSRIGVEHT